MGRGIQNGPSLHQKGFDSCTVVRDLGLCSRVYSGLNRLHFDLRFPRKSAVKVLVVPAQINQPLLTNDGS
jgi:hypothetical protein